MLRVLCICAAISISAAAFGQTPSFNEDMIAAVEALKADPARRLQGYDLNSWFTKKQLDYGSDKRAIDGKGSPQTMCNAAVTETFIEAINKYAARTPGWNPESAIPKSAWNTPGWSNLRLHFFSNNYFDFAPLKELLEAERRVILPATLIKEIKDFHSEYAMAVAIQKFKLGEPIKFEIAKPGDIISFDRQHYDANGNSKGSGHSVVFLNFVYRNQDEGPIYKANEVVGFKYFSSQGDAGIGKGGLSERYAYFNGFCPYQAGHGIHRCRDAISSPSNRSRFPEQIKGRERDCCVYKTGLYGPRVGRFWAPSMWKFQEGQAAVAAMAASLKPRVDEFVRNRATAALIIEIISKGVVSLEEKSPGSTRAYQKLVKTRYGIDIATAGPKSAIAKLPAGKLKALRADTPAFIKAAANRQITPQIRDELEARIVAAENAANANFSSALQDGVPNRKFDGGGANP